MITWAMALSYVLYKCPMNRKHLMSSNKSTVYSTNLYVVKIVVQGNGINNHCSITRLIFQMILISNDCSLSCSLEITIANGFIFYIPMVVSNDM